MTDKLINEFKQNIEGLTLLPSNGGRFEVTIDGELVYSKLKEKRFPEYNDIQPHVQKRMS